MTIDVALHPAEILNVSSDTIDYCVVIDVLRASTSICCAFSKGARRIIPTLDSESALKIKSEQYPTALLTGERHAFIIEGFDHGNSPTEFMSVDFLNRDVVMTTSNGTKLLHSCAKYSRASIGAIVNARAVTQDFSRSGAKSVLLACAGAGGRTGLDDVFASGAIISEAVTANATIQLTESAILCLELFRKGEGDIFLSLCGFLHGQNLQSLGFEEDIRIASSLNCFDFVPIVDDHPNLSITLQQP